MSTQTQTSEPTEFSIHPAARPGLIALTVSNLDKQIAFYQQALGFHLHWREDKRAGLGAGGEDLLQLVEEPDLAGKRYQRTTGLYHFAIVFPNRRELALAVARLFALKVRNYPTDHIMTKTTYLDDPEGNGIELYAESAEDGSFVIDKNGDFVTRRADGSLSDGREPLDLDALFSLLQADDRLDLPLPEGTRLGHVHLHVRDVQEAVDFYHGLLGFDVMGQSSTFQAAFVSAGGYHHHIGLNAWKGVGAPPPPADALGMRYFSVRLPDTQSLTLIKERLAAAGIAVNQTADGVLLQDPSKNGVLLVVDR
ncbi:MAG: glyoxalase [Chloroflexi bacterium HGW-Chloroflexi-10]|nr:MAG: glyoxalase [Chloroflexi bacterium HGW-Chloroflexi-10]